MASPASKRAAVVLLVVVASVMMATPSEAMRPRRKAAAALVSSEARVLRFPGFPGSRQRFPGFPGARPSPRAAPPKPSPPSSSSSSVPGLPLSPPAGALPPPCGRSSQTTPPGTLIPGMPGSGGGGSSPTDCVTSLAGLTTCLCPVILGDVNRMLPKPVDPVRMMYLPIACGLVLPPQVLFICFTGQPNPPVLSRVPASWSTLSSDTY
uniref:Bifunctional inhibitor/plant lipid transfer protein/seed storage helical domain-containing protein n=1 Tax=Oryza nivara TaxID=4536 RepID=A0A0E0IX60_ORYNI